MFAFCVALLKKSTKPTCIFGIQIGCSWSAIKDYKLGTKDSKKTISQEQ